MVNASPEMKQYFEEIDEKLKVAYGVANKAREKGYDPEEKVDIPLAESMAERVEGLMSDVAPQLVGSGMTKRIEELEQEYSPLDWRVALKIAEEVAKEKFCKFKDKREAMEVGIRAGFAYHTCGIVAAPLEGFIELKIKKTKEGKEYFSPFYAGPIRGAGGTAAAFSVLLTDYVRKKMGYARYDPDENEIKRYKTEIDDYHEYVTNLQYHPTEEEIEFLAKRLPVEINGDPTEKREVSNYKDLARVETNLIRGGMCLVLAEGIAQKAPKLWKRIEKWGKDFDLKWDFLKEFISLQKKIKAKTEVQDGEEKPKITPNYTFIKDMVAGRLVLTYPMRAGGFRLRYGRSRASGFSAAAIHPATQLILNNFIAAGTQLKVERPGKAAAITPCDTIEGPIVKLSNGSVMKLNNETQAKENLAQVKEIIFLGDILFNYGDFSENGHILVPPGYCEEWYVQELEKATVNLFGNLDLEKLSDLLGVPTENLDELLKNPFGYKVSAGTAINISQKLRIPLHPSFTYYWKLISVNQLKDLIKWLRKSKVRKIGTKIEKIILPLDESKTVLETIGIPHQLVNNEFVLVEKDHANILFFVLGITDENSLDFIEKKIDESDGCVLEIVNELSDVEIRDKAGTFIGARMGRPEKAKMRKLTGSPHTLFPVGDEGGRLRCFQAAMDAGKITADFPVYKCSQCDKETIYPVCEGCGKKTTRIYYCPVCGPKQEECAVHNDSRAYKKKSIDITHYFEKALQQLKMPTYPDLIKGVRGTSNKDHTPEHLVKGILRAKHDIYVNKDGTTRYDMSELPITHFKPKEIRTSIEKLKQLGYTKDIKGRDLVNEEQILELKPQDIILSSYPGTFDNTADDTLFKVGNFIDELLVKLYGQEPFYNFSSKNDLVGHLVVGLAPHISAGIVARVIGFSDTQAFFAHPLLHAAMRRDCDGDEACVILLMDTLLNFSRQFLPDKRGSRTMDSCLVLTSRLVPSEVDDQVHGLDVVWKYPLEFYESALEYKPPWEVDIEQLGKRLDTEKQYEKIGFTHNVSNINMGVNQSAYKILPSMEEKLKGQMEIAEKIRAVDESDVARLVIEKHFIKDTKGNLRKFSMQKFRCVKCNEKFRRPPLVGRCTHCGGKIIFTISEGSIIKYLEPSISLAKKYEVSTYLMQSLELTKRRIEDNFGREKEKQVGLGDWFG
jgi:DNA polymerase II large subunit